MVGYLEGILLARMPQQSRAWKSHPCWVMMGARTAPRAQAQQGEVQAAGESGAEPGPATQLSTVKPLCTAGHSTAAQVSTRDARTAPSCSASCSETGRTAPRGLWVVGSSNRALQTGFNRSQVRGTHTVLVTGLVHQQCEGEGLASLGTCCKGQTRN